MLTVLLVVLAIATVLSLVNGQMIISPGEVFASIGAKLGIGTVDPAHAYSEAALWTVRFPRVALALVVGAALSVAGVLMQGVFGNPLAEPGVIGVSSGAAVGACTVIVFGLSALGSWTLVVAAFLGGLGATMLAYRTARRGGRTEVVTLVLTGVAINAVCGALIALLVFLGDTQAREEIVFWQLGSLNGARWTQVAVVAPLTVTGIVAALCLARQLDLLSLGERSARHLGVDVEHLRRIAILIVAVLTSAAVAFGGIISFVGLVIPHLVRMVLGPGHRWLIIVSAVGGSALLLIADLLARTLVTYAELPIGMLTALVGGPFFFWLIRRGSRGAGGWA
ncbi:iron ABC transporter permease [Tessaracoccus palaemonis]|uniref:Iron ABC transporter permease n=2 Tax=Tessaracoccus palaemonis TaxID=2829499 RepID=A0ABX8SLZ7_9ACTN|nr:iron ABC transporter permease [Tessaracoccus palaemonis]